MSDAVLSKIQLAQTQFSHAFVKVSGDEFLNPHFHEWVRDVCQRAHTVICVGGGTQINDAFAQNWLTIQKHPIRGRETDERGYRLAQSVLEKNKALLRDALHAVGVRANIVLPIIYIGSRRSHVDADQMVINAYNGFDALYVITSRDRLVKKIAQFSDWPKVQVVGF